MKIVRSFSDLGKRLGRDETHRSVSGRCKIRFVVAKLSVS